MALNRPGMKDAPITISDDELSGDDIKFSHISLSASNPQNKRKRNEEPITISSDDESPPPPVPKRARTTTQTQVAAPLPPPEIIMIDESAAEESEEDYDEISFNAPPSVVNEICLDVEDWPIPRVQLPVPKLRKRGETVLDAHLRQLGQFVEENRLFEHRRVTGALNSLRACFPIVRSHRPTAQWTQQRNIGPLGADALTLYRAKKLKLLTQLRLGGCPNTISQSNGIAIIAANVHGADTDQISPANHNGLTAISCSQGMLLPFKGKGLDGKGHARVAVPTKNSSSQKLSDSTDNMEYSLIYETVFDVQFDPANPARFITAGNDKRGIIWELEGDLEMTVLSTDHGNHQVEDEILRPQFMEDIPMSSRPHFVRFSPNPNHWSNSNRPSAFIMTDANGKFLLQFPTRKSFTLPVNPDKPDQEIASIVWGTGRSENLLFAGTESQGFLPSFDKGKQAAFRIHPSSAPSKLYYTSSHSEVEALALNPIGDLLASFTRRCQVTGKICNKCGKRTVHSRHTLSLYPAHGHKTKPSGPGKKDALVAVDLPDFDIFKKSDTANDAGIVVSAAWSPCGKYIAAARDDDFIDLFDIRYLTSQPLMRLAHQTPNQIEKYRPAYNLHGDVSDCCITLEKHPKHGITGLQWIQGSGYFGGEGLLSAGSDGCVRLWDIHQANVNEVLVQLETSAACISVGNVSRKEISLIVADNDGLVEMRTAAT